MFKLECQNCGEMFEDIESAVNHAESIVNCEDADYRIEWDD